MADPTFIEQFPEQSVDDYAREQGLPSIAPTPFKAFDPADLPRRQWLYGRHYCAGFVSVTAGHGGAGKTQRNLAEAVAITSGVPILGKPVTRRLKCWHYNLEDPKEELERRIAAIVQDAQARGHDIKLAMLEGWLFLDSGRESNRRLIVAEQQGGQIIATPHAMQLPAYIKDHGISILQVDPFLRSHRCEENSNTAIDGVMAVYTDCAENTGCAIDLGHHLRKTGNDRPSVEDTRGGSAIIGAARTIRMMCRMSEQEAKAFGLDEAERRYMVRTDPTAKANMLPPAEHAEWHRFISVELPNRHLAEPGDNVGVLVPWMPPDAWEGVTEDKIHDFLAQVDEKAKNGQPYSPNVRATKRWVGNLVKEIFDKDEGPAKIMIKAWTDNDVLETFEYETRGNTYRGIRRGTSTPCVRYD